MRIEKNYSRGTLAGILFVCHALSALPSALAENGDEAQAVERIRKIVLSRGDNPAMLAHLVQLSKDLPPLAAAKLYDRLGDEYLRAGQFNQGADVLRQLVDQFPDQPPAIDGLIKLVQLYSSSEVAHVTQITPKSTKNSTLPIYALYLAEQALQKHRDWTDHSALTFQCAVAARRSGNPRTAKSWLSPLKHNPKNQPWHQGALVETWLQGTRKEDAPKPTTHCLHADKRPHLDGVLEEQIWQAATPISLAADSTQIKFARDAAFLYLAVRCQKLDHTRYVADKFPRAYDANLTEQDHVRLLLDLDRDYATCFQLSIDHRGQTADACWHDDTWNPRWFVAASSDESFWTIEAAIPWTELTNTPPPSRTVWALAVNRQTPTGPSQTWTGTPSKFPTPENFGLLLFD